ncbi:hypothetical protein DH2020_013380 [Rehmannia glutinosa]|uniref:Phospholipase D alpha 1 n=1 Tax=Rehmannia glutinosa TaxID=99300 RepID=A0ABR0X2B5_REHGL
MAQILLHGTLHVTIFEVDRLHGEGGGGNFFGKLMENIGETVGIGKGTPKIYATVDLEKSRVGRTRMIENEPNNPKWHESFHIYCAHNASNVIFTVKDDNPIGATLIGVLTDSRRRRRGDVTLGELLKKKAKEGVTVLMLVWDDRTSVGLLKKDGLMATHDEETEQYFQGTEVHCVLCPRDPDDGGSFVQNLQISTMFTHHQKIVVVDSDLPNGGGRSRKRRIVSFVGGIDLCDGRYDTPFHSLFRRSIGPPRRFSSGELHRGAITKGGPRSLGTIFIPGWKDRLLGTYSDRSTVGQRLDFPKPRRGGGRGLVSGKDNIIDRSIQDAYIHAIRRAKSFIYIENQYFLGSCFGWDCDDIKVEEIGALHLIPKELSLKIVSKIEAGERFTVYVVVPMWPEGIPESASVQAILDWQKRTMEMMYKDVVRALRAKGIEEDPRNYLTFFCLGNREVKKSGEYEPSEKPEPDSDYLKAQEARRFMIYVHAKMMIVDDEYIIIGSANINQRSMDGSRDSEIAMGGYQPHHLASRQHPARGQIHGFRMALWYEHLGMLDDSFLQPQNQKCVRKVNEMADKYWDLYANEELERDLPGHLLRYPIGISSEGAVTELPGHEFFLDTKARVLGLKSDYLPLILTT